jgi:hypothetical protein
VVSTAQRFRSMPEAVSRTSLYGFSHFQFLNHKPPTSPHITKPSLVPARLRALRPTCAAIISRAADNSSNRQSRSAQYAGNPNPRPNYRRAAPLFSARPSEWNAALRPRTSIGFRSQGVRTFPASTIPAGLKLAGTPTYAKPHSIQPRSHDGGGAAWAGRQNTGAARTDNTDSDA